MKHPSLRQLFEYWSGRRGEVLPGDMGVEPGAIRSVLADTFMLSCARFGAYRFCTAGTRVCALLGRELKGAAFLDLWSGASRNDVSELLAIITGESAAVVASVDGRCGIEGAITLQLLLLPVVLRGRTDARIVGALVAGGRSDRFGKRRVDRLELGMRRYLGEARSSTGVRHAGPRRPALLVYEGGLAEAQ
jgi:hypothetical protein